MKKLILISSLLLFAGCYFGNKNMNEYDADYSAQILMPTLNMAYKDEILAEKTYQTVLDKFGDVQPFLNIMSAEQRHSQAIEKLYESFNYPLPDLSKENYKIKDFVSIKEACAYGAEGEVANIKMYDELLAQIENEKVIRVFENLRSASENKHLPAFQSCAK